jgi:hypothetical protein
MWLWNETYGLLKSLHPFMAGSTFALNLVAALLFLRFYRRTRDRLFLFFAAAFAIMGVNRLIFTAAVPADNAQEPLQYVARLVAFLLIIYAIIDKNRRLAHPRS